MPHGVLTALMTWRVRAIEPPDGDAVAALFRRSFRDAMPWLPDLHTPEEDRNFFAARIEDSVGWVAEGEGAIIGFILCSVGWVNHLYVDIGHQGTGIGSALLERAVDREGAGVQLWAFQRNQRAREFYAQRGFVEVEMTDGLGNEEREPDVRLRLS